MSGQISVMEAIRIAAQSMKDYTDGNALFYGKTQNLTSGQRTQAKENIGIFTGSIPPSTAKEGDIWFEEEAEETPASE